MNKNLIKLIYLYPTILWFYNRNYKEFVYLKNFALELYKKISLSGLSDVELEELIEILRDYAKFIPEFKVAHDQASFFLKVTMDVSKAIKKQSESEDDIFDDGFGVSTDSTRFKP